MKNLTTSTRNTTVPGLYLGPSDDERENLETMPSAVFWSTSITSARCLSDLLMVLAILVV